MKYVETETESWNLKINTPKQHCQTVFYVFIVIFERIFYLGLFFLMLTLRMKMTNGGVNSMILTVAIKVTINISKKPTWTRLFLQ